MISNEVKPEEVVRYLGKKYGLTREQASVLIEFHEARERRDHHVHGSAADFDRMREELGKTFPDMARRHDLVNDYEHLFAS